MKRTELAKRDAERLINNVNKPGAGTFGKAGAEVVDKREQRKRDQALGLVPFAVKLNGDTVKRLHALATERGVDLNTLVAQVLEKGLA